jgi:hypothetical protein
MTDTEATTGEAMPVEPGTVPSDAGPPIEGPAIGWPRAIASSLAVLLVGFFGGVVGANAILTKSLALTRTAREWLATALFFVVLIILATVLRWLQQRGLI